MISSPEDIFKTSSLIDVGNAERLADDLAHMLQRLPMSAWPMQSDDGKGLRPAMVNNLLWPPGEKWTLQFAAEALVRSVRTPFQVVGIPTEHARTPMFSVVMPDRYIPTHSDRQEDTWLGRLHLPVVTNPSAQFFIGNQWREMTRGSIYLVDVRQPHAVRNLGLFPRIHLMVDLHRGPS